MYFVLLIHLLQVLHVYSQDIVRLQRTYPKREGPIEIFYQGTWHTICGECWADNAANVACRELGFGGGVKERYRTRQNITAIQYTCSTGQESRLTSCQLIESCYQCGQAAGIRCSGAVKLVELNPPSTRQVVSVFGSYKGSYIWGHVCGECWTEFNVEATCKGLGYRSYRSGNGSMIKQKKVQSDSNHWNAQYRCKESDADLGSCKIIKTSCSSCDNYAAVECSTEAKVSVDGVWGSWSPYGPCSVTCGGGGYRNRNRTCNNPAPAYGGRECTGNAQQSKLCEEINCPIDGVWGSWSPYGPCSVTCGGGGYRNRNRTCNNPAPAYGGRECTGNAQQSKLCEEINCPIDGVWGSWSPYGPCSVTCGGRGYRNRNRTCNNPAPAYGGRECTGNAQQSKLCEEINCPIDGVWGSWSPYGPCSVTCGGGGYRNRNRTCNNPAPAYGGRECTGNAQQSKLCEEINCPIDGGWGRWGDFGPCSVTCGRVYQIRTRTCDRQPKHGGRSCGGEGRDGKACKETEYIDGGWSKWSDFGPCSVTCGQGHQIRTRTCDNPSPKHGGRGCDGEGRDGKACKETECANKGGRDCHGDSRDEKTCKEKECAKTWNKMCSTDSQCAGNLVCKDNTTCYCRHETDVWDPTNLRCQSSSEFLAMYSQEEMDFDSAIEYCAVNMTGFMATQDHINNMFISCMDTNHVTWLSDIRTMTDTNNEEDDVCWTGRVDQNNDILVTNASCMEPRHFVCVINRTNIIPVSEEPACYGFSKTKVTTVKGGIPLGILIAVVATSCVVLLVAAAAIVLNKRKRHTKRKLNSGSQSNPLQITYRHNTTQAAGKMAPQTGYFSECATGGPSEDTNHYSEGTAGSSTDTDNYGYGLLGKTGSRSVRMGEEDMYSHTKPGQPLDDGYDVFVKRKETVDESGVYDHVGNCMIEGEYDSFQGKTIVPVENNYSEYL